MSLIKQLEYVGVDAILDLGLSKFSHTAKGDTFEFEVSQENFDFMENWFEKPKASELKNGIIITE